MTLPADLALIKFPASKAVVYEFPFRSELSFRVLVQRACPKLTAHIRKNALPETPVFEIYDQE